MKTISKDELFALFDKKVRDEISQRLKQTYVDGIVVFENINLSSPHVGHRTACVYGAPYTLKSADDAKTAHLHDLPSLRQHAVAIYTKPEAAE